MVKSKKKLAAINKHNKSSNFKIQMIINNSKIQNKFLLIDKSRFLNVKNVRRLRKPQIKYIINKTCNFYKMKL